ncbi:glutamyl-tRNA reductase, partial [Staphylococcus lugdunensis]
NITIVNRTVGKAKALANKHQVKFDSLDALPNLLQQADIVISSTSSESYIITNDLIESIADQRKLDALLLVDIAVPRDIEPGI